jgi:hypothetical protein
MVLPLDYVVVYMPLHKSLASANLRAFGQE